MIFSIPTTLGANAYKSTWQDQQRNIPRSAQRNGYVPEAARNAATTLSTQLHKIFKQTAPQGGIRIICTVPVNLNDFKKSNHLSRQMAEEMALLFVEDGYLVQEIRRNTQITMRQQQGEFFLTRDTDALMASDVEAELVLTGTYSISTKGVRFNFKVLHAQNADILAMAGITVPLYEEIRPLLKENMSETVLAPTVGTKLP